MSSIFSFQAPVVFSGDQDAEVLMKYVPSLTQTLIGISNAETSPNTQKVIKELRDMIVSLFQKIW